MLDGCGIETEQGCARLQPLDPVAIDARWLWNRDVGLRMGTTSTCVVAIDARWLWNRD